MTTWSEGYVSDIAYSIAYYREMAPDHLAFSALAVGKSPGLAVKPKRVLELGFGMGVGFIIGAASQPETFFEGCDFNPEHISHAQTLADAAGLTNVAIREASFQELASEAREGQHDIDIIQLHGILTWVSIEARQSIIEIARKRLKPGGLLYVSYNSMPGWAHLLPMRHVMREHAKRHGGSSLNQVVGAVGALKQLATANGRYFASNPLVGSRIEKLGSMQPSYLAHEYFNENWFVFHFSEVAAMMSDAKLNFLASASIAENIDNITAPVEMRAQIAEAADPIWKETLRDLACNKQFRRDIYARGITDLNNIETMAHLHNLRFTLAIPRSAMSLKMTGPMGEMDAKAEIYNPLADLLADRIVDFGEIATTKAMMPIGLAGTLQALALMVHAGHVLPIIGEANTDFAPAKRLNKVLIDYATRGRVYNFLAAPAARAALQVTSIDMMGVSAVQAGKENDTAAVTQHVIDMMSRHGSKPLKEGKAIEDPTEMRELITEEVTKFLAEKLPLFRRLGCL